MADFGGFTVKTPQDVLAELDAQRQQISMLPPAQQRNANIQFQIANMFGNPELEKAKKLEKNLQLATKVVDEDPVGTQGSLEYESHRLETMYKAVKDLDPMAASQIQTRLVEVREAQFQQARLKGQDNRAERMAAINEANAARAARFDEWNFSISKDGKVESFDPSDPESNDAFIKSIRAGGTPLTQAQAAAQLGKAAVDKAMSDRFNKSSHEKKVNTYAAHEQFLTKAARMVDILAAMPAAGTNVAEIQKSISGIAAEGRALLGAMTSDDGYGFNLGATRAEIKAKIDALDDSQLPAGIKRGQLESLVLNMGYVLARGLDSGGRLSDQDVNMAIGMLLGGGTVKDGFINPKIMASVLLQNAVGTMDVLTGTDADIYTREAATAGDRQSQDVLKLQAKLRSSYEGKFLPSVRRILNEDEIKYAIDPFGGEGDDEDNTGDWVIE